MLRLQKLFAVKEAIGPQSSPSIDALLSAVSYVDVVAIFDVASKRSEKMPYSCAACNCTNRFTIERSAGITFHIRLRPQRRHRRPCGRTVPSLSERQSPCLCPVISHARTYIETGPLLCSANTQ
ncbi:hypothetical protein ATANTOWER_005297 [Ataeniobius toweri]|uniref:C2H2-type domain-containing protein n=1 Tax=Ataeniobius toweri TaxID=208326 RepID=A0ABU7BED0_9TELE|nr:hypothetical protein [Ataeniobius toweri]